MQQVLQSIDIDKLFEPILNDERIWADDITFDKERMKILAKLIRMGCDRDTFIQIGVELSRRRLLMIKERLKNSDIDYLT